MTYRLVGEPALRFAQLVLLGEAVMRGIDYLIAPAGITATMTQAEQTLPLWIWGALCLIPGLAGLGAEAALQYKPVQASFRPKAWERAERWLFRISDGAHAALALLFLVLFFSATAGVLLRQPLYGISTPYDLLAFSVGHWVFATRMRRR